MPTITGNIRRSQRLTLNRCSPDHGRPRHSQAALRASADIPPSACWQAARATGTGNCSTSTRCRPPDLNMRLSAAKVTGALENSGRTAFGANLRSPARSAPQRRRGADVWRCRQGLVRDRALRRGRRCEAPNSSSPMSICRLAHPNVFVHPRKLSCFFYPQHLAGVTLRCSLFGLASSLDGTAMLTATTARSRTPMSNSF